MVSAFNLTQELKPYVASIANNGDLEIATFLNVAKSFLFGRENSLFPIIILNEEK